MIKELLKQKNMSVFECSKRSGVPYTTLLELTKNITNIENCNVRTAYKLATVFDMTIEELIKKQNNNLAFEEFKSNLCHELKEKGDIKFLIDILTNKYIDEYYKAKQYDKAFYVLAMVDYLSKENNIPFVKEYDYLRNKKLSETVYPRDVIMRAIIMKNDDAKLDAKKKSIKEFIKYNIVETNIRNVV